MKVFTYYDPTVQQCGLPPQDGVLRLWSESWRRHGWEPHVLTDRVVRMAPGFKEFEARVNKLPTVNSRAYENACYFRWLALAQAGGGLMTDYDVINFGFRPRVRARSVEMLDPTYVPCAVWAGKFGARDIVNMILKSRVRGEHISDMLIFKSQFDRKRFGPPGTECIEFSVPGWEKAPLVHFSSGKTQPFGSKSDAIIAAQKIHA